MYEEHPAFSSPPDRHQRVWRYMDLTKFVSLVTSSKLFFPNAVSLGDPYEGTYPVANERLLDRDERFTPDQREAHRLQQLRDQDDNLISCWHMNDGESDAMWRAYASRGYGVAIQSTFERLTRAFEYARPMYMGTVTYVDYDGAVFDFTNAFIPFIFKRRGFEHEQELRVVTTRLRERGSSVRRRIPYRQPCFGHPMPPDPGDVMRAMQILHGGLDDRATDEIPPFRGSPISTDLDTLIEAVYVAPGTPVYHEQAIRALLDRFGPEAEVVRSRLYDSPSS